MTTTHSPSERDKRFVQALEAFDLAPGDFDHRAHVRMAYTYLCENDGETTSSKIREVLCGFLTHAARRSFVAPDRAPIPT